MGDAWVGDLAGEGTATELGMSADHSRLVNTDCLVQVGITYDDLALEVADLLLLAVDGLHEEHGVQENLAGRVGERGSGHGVEGLEWDGGGVSGCEKE